MGEELLLETQHRFAGAYPDVPLAAGIDYNELTEGDDKPFFVTLPIGKVGARSRNRRVYDKESMVEIVKQINEKRPGGNQGHLPPTDRSHAFPLPALRWVGAILQEQSGLAWGKAYVAKERPDVREYFRVAMRAGARVATSLYGLTDTDGERVVNPQIETVDIADPERAGVDETKAIPKITSEMAQEDSNRGDDEMADYNELIAERDTLKRQLTEAQTQVAALQASQTKMTGLVEMADGGDPTEVLKELKGFKAAVSAATKSDDPLAFVNELVSQRDTLAEMAGQADVANVIKQQNDLLAEMKTLVGGDNVIELVKALQTKLASLQTEYAGMLSEMVTSAVNTGIKVPSVRPVIQQLMVLKNPQTREEIKTMLSEIMEAEDTKALLEKGVLQEMGEPQKSTVVASPASTYKFIVIPDAVKEG